MKSKVVKALQLEESGSVGLGELELPLSLKNKYLIRIEYGGICELDLKEIENSTKKRVSSVLGFEGSGVLVNKKHKLMNCRAKETRVCFVQRQGELGSWSKYTLVDKSMCVKLRSRSIGLMINPLEAIMLASEIPKHEASIVAVADPTPLAGIFYRYCSHLNICVIQVAKSKNHALQMQGQNVLSVDDPQFARKFKHMSHEMNTTWAVDFLGEELSGKVLKLMPQGSVMCTYGANEELTGLNPKHLVLKHKKVYGMSFWNWFEELPRRKLKKHFKYVALNPHLFSTKVHKSFALEEYSEAIAYAKSKTLEGKIVFDLSKKTKSPDNVQTQEPSFLRISGLVRSFKQGPSYVLYKTLPKFDWEAYSPKSKDWKLLGEDLYKGNFKEGLQEGPGKCFFSDGSIYEGYWAEAMFEGKGRLVTEYEVTEGHWKKGQLHGYGNITRQDGSVLAGNFQRGQIVQGIEICANGNRYEGHFKNGKKHGLGKLVTKNQKEEITFEGMFVKGVMKGQGTVKFGQDMFFEGYLEGAGGEGIMNFKDGSLFQGKIVGMKLEGEGLYISPQGTHHKCRYSKGKIVYKE